MSLTNQEVILAKVETTYGVDAVPDPGTDAKLIENLAWSNEGLRMNERPAVRASFGKLKQIYGGSLRTITFDVEIKGSGAAGTPPEIGTLLRGCAMDESIVAVTSVTYGPVSSTPESLTIYYYQGNVLYKLLGARGNVSFNLETGAIGKASFTFTGHSPKPIDDGLPVPTYSAEIPVPVINAPFAIGSFNAVVNALTLDMSNAIAQPPDMGATDGYGQIQITGRDPNGSYDPEADTLANDDPFNALRTGQVLAMTSGNIGLVAGNIYNLTMPAVSYRDISPGDRDAIRTYEIPYGAAEVGTDDDVQLQFI